MSKPSAGRRRRRGPRDWPSCRPSAASGRPCAAASTTGHSMADAFAGGQDGARDRSNIGPRAGSRHRLAGAGARVAPARQVGRQAREAQVGAGQPGRRRSLRQVVVADMSSLGSVRDAVTHIAGVADRLDVLVDNAGAIYPERTDSDDGIEKTLAILVCGPFVLISGLLPLLRRSDRAGDRRHVGRHVHPARAPRRPRVAQPAVQRRARLCAGEAHPGCARCASGRAATRDADVSFNAMHPGWADTPVWPNHCPASTGCMKPLSADARAGRRHDRSGWPPRRLSPRPAGGCTSIAGRGRSIARRRPGSSAMIGRFVGHGQRHDRTQLRSARRACARGRRRGVARPWPRLGRVGPRPSTPVRAVEPEARRPALPRPARCAA